MHLETLFYVVVDWRQFGPSVEAPLLIMWVLKSLRSNAKWASKKTFFTENGHSKLNVKGDVIQPNFVYHEWPNWIMAISTEAYEMYKATSEVCFPNANRDAFKQ